MHDHDRHGARQPQRFDPRRADVLDDPARFTYLSVDDVLALLAPRDGATVLDFGTGTGTYAYAIARRRPDVCVIALDEQPEMLSRVEGKRAHESGSVVAIGPADAMRYAGRIDALLALNVLHELGTAALRALPSLLAPDGRAAIVDWRGDIERPVGPPRDHVYTPEQARQRITDAGFAVVAQHSFAYHFGLVGVAASREV